MVRDTPSNVKNGFQSLFMKETPITTEKSKESEEGILTMFTISDVPLFLVPS